MLLEGGVERLRAYRRFMRPFAHGGLLWVWVVFGGCLLTDVYAYILYTLAMELLVQIFISHLYHSQYHSLLAQGSVPAVGAQGSW